MSTAKSSYIYPMLVKNIGKLKDGEFWLAEYEAMPERWQLCVLFLYVEMLSMSMRDMGQVSKAELALKLSRVLVGTESVKDQ